MRYKSKPCGSLRLSYLAFRVQTTYIRPCVDSVIKFPFINVFILKYFFTERCNIQCVEQVFELHSKSFLNMLVLLFLFFRSTLRLV